jgi:hypothetical protein
MTTKYDIEQKVLVNSYRGGWISGIIKEIKIYSEDTILYRIHDLEKNVLTWYQEDLIEEYDDNN